MSTSMVKTAANLCEGTTVEAVHDWVARFNQAFQQEVNPVAVIIEMNKDGANIPTNCEYNRQGVAAVSKFQTGPDGDMQLSVSIGMPVPASDADSIEKILKDLVECCIVALKNKHKVRTRKIWTADEDALLRSSMDNTPVRDIAQLLDRTVPSVATRISHIRSGRLQ